MRGPSPTETTWERARYAGALARAVPLGALVRGALRRLRRSGLGDRGPRVLPPSASPGEAEAAAAALVAAPRLFTPPSTARALYRLALPGALARSAGRAERMLDGEVELFGRVAPAPRAPYAPQGGRGDSQDAGPIDWQRDPRTGLRFDGSRRYGADDLLEPGPDPRGAWELGRGGHLVELATAAALCPRLAGPAARHVARTLLDFLDENPLGAGVHWTSPLEASLRAIHWMAAIDLLAAAGHPLVTGERGDAAGRRIAGSLIEHGRFVAGNLEDGGFAVGNHLLGDLAALVALGSRLGRAAEAPAWRALAIVRLPAEARRQVEPDGADFEASTAYHRFALELLAAAERFAAAAGLDAGVGPTLDRMYQFVAGYLDPSGCEPGFGDSDEGRCLPLGARDPRRHDYLLAVGAARSGDARLRRVGLAYAEEAVWLHGAAGWRRFRALSPLPPPRLSSMVSGGVHTARSGGAFVAMRAGSAGQRGVGGHAHNDQLSLVVHLGGAPLIVEGGTFCYAADPVWRDRFRGTAAHSTVVVEGLEQSPLFEGRPFALPDRARGRLLALEELGDGAACRIVGSHDGYMRLPQRVRHLREVLIDAHAAAVVITDRLEGEGVVSAEGRLHLGPHAVRAAQPSEIEALGARLEDVPWSSGSGPASGAPRAGADALIVVDEEGCALAAIVALPGTAALEVAGGWWSPRYGERRAAKVVRWSQRARLPIGAQVALLSLAPRDRQV